MAGLRTQRADGTKTYSYVYNGGTLSQMTVGSDTLTFTYDASGRPLSVTLYGTTYYYVTNLQGDVTAILNTSGTAVVNYTYDAWGNPLTTSGDLATTLGTLNPLRYRGYVYDTETGIYYVSSRYYSPDTERFLNADILVSTGQGILGNNMFAYCRNNPVSRRDISGNNDEDCLSDKQDEDLVPDISGGGNFPSENAGVQVGTVGSTGSSIQIRVSPNGIPAAPNPENEKTEIHHIVERCQIKKTGFSQTDINGNSNLIEIPQKLHHKISGYYSSKPPEMGGLRVRDWLAGKPIEFQRQFGIDVIERIWGELYE